MNTSPWRCAYCGKPGHTRCECPELVVRPQQRSECAGGIRPCPYVSCSEHLIWTNPQLYRGRSDDEIVEQVVALEHSCARDLLNPEGQTTALIGIALGVSRQRVEQLLVSAQRKLRQRDFRLGGGLKEAAQGDGASTDNHWDAMAELA